ncbi:MAG: AMP-binding protein [Bacteroidales bacterium]|nr:AMP-binding protein [Bacteroidales bacterium]
MNAVDYFFSESKNSEQLFILTENEQITHKILYKKVEKLAAFLNSEFGSGKNMLIYSGNSYFFVLAYLSIIKSGNVCVPLNPSAKTELTEYIIKETQAVLCFSQKKFLRNLEQLKLNLITEDEAEKAIEMQYVTEYILTGFDIEQTAEIIFTSGSTAFPKGVMLSHKNLIANTKSIIEYLGLTKSDRVLIVLPFYYCYGLSLLHTHLKVGGAIAFNNTFMFIGTVINNLKKYKCTGFSGVPSHFQILLRKSDSFKKTDFPDLKYVTQAGGKLHSVFIEEFLKHFPSIKFWVMYGQTEATARLAYLPPEKLPEKLGSLGKAIPGVKLELLKKDGKPAVIGEIGEIVASGDNIMKGYYHDDEMTAQTIKNGKLYTGDLAIQDEDGFFYITARKKEIIKVGGERISPKEIEEVIVRFENVVDCTIEGVDDEVLGERIKATVVLNKLDNEQLIKEEILAHCKKYLSPIKIPQELVFEQQVKVNEAGKKVKQV